MDDWSRQIRTSVSQSYKSQKTIARSIARYHFTEQVLAEQRPVNRNRFLAKM